MSKVLHVRVVNVDGVLETVQALVPRGPFGQTKAKVSEMKIPLIISIQKKTLQGKRVNYSKWEIN